MISALFAEVEPHDKPSTDYLDGDGVGSEGAGRRPALENDGAGRRPALDGAGTRRAVALDSDAGRRGVETGGSGNRA
nr:hypothetical protein Iba_chr13eCG7970 [Ipomoea batatas]